MKKYLTLGMLGWFLTGILALMLGTSGMSKVIATQEMVTNFEYFKLSSYLQWVGVAECVGLVLLVIPRTSIYGAVIITSLMSGAAALHLSILGGQGVMNPIIVGALAWSSHCLRTYKPHRKRKTNS